MTQYSHPIPKLWVLPRKALFWLFALWFVFPVPFWMFMFWCSAPMSNFAVLILLFGYAFSASSTTILSSDPFIPSIKSLLFPCSSEVERQRASEREREAGESPKSRPQQIPTRTTSSSLIYFSRQIHFFPLPSPSPKVLYPYISTFWLEFLRILIVSSSCSFPIKGTPATTCKLLINASLITALCMWCTPHFRSLLCKELMIS